MTQRFRAKAESRVGKTFTLMLDRRNCVANVGTKILPIPSMHETGFYVSRGKPVTFEIDSIEHPQIDYEYYKVKLVDGTVGYMTVVYFSPSRGADKYERANDCLFEGTADAVYAAVRADQVEDEQREAVKREAENREAEIRAKRLARPGVKLGMSKREVEEKTSWGPPLSVNKTVSAGVTFEQWVYEQNQYLYFRNGRLVAIQNSGQ